jgi:hypothetical protein
MQFETADSAQVDRAHLLHEPKTLRGFGFQFLYADSILGFFIALALPLIAFAHIVGRKRCFHMFVHV